MDSVDKPGFVMEKNPDKMRGMNWLQFHFLKLILMFNPREFRSLFLVLATFIQR